MHEMGKGGVQQNLNEAIRWYRLSAAQGYAEAKQRLAMLGVPAVDPNAPSIGAGMSGSTLGRTVNPNPNPNPNPNINHTVSARPLSPLDQLKAKAEQHNGQAQAELAAHYELGTGGASVDEMEAFKWYKLAAADGNAAGQAGLAFMYLMGRGTMKDAREAEKLSKLAANQGNPRGFNNLGVLYQSTGKVEEAATNFRKSAERGYDPGRFNYGNVLEKGEGVAKDPDAAMAMYRLAAANGYKLAVERVALLEAKEREARDLLRQQAIDNANNANNNVGAGVDPADENKICVVCLTSKVTHVFVPCGHLICCEPCGKQVRQCPLCRSNISQRVKVFTA